MKSKLVGIIECKNEIIELKSKIDVIEREKKFMEDEFFNKTKINTDKIEVIL